MSDVQDLPFDDFALEAHLLGEVDFDRVQALQQRLVYEAGSGLEATMRVLVCEHPPLVTIGRAGSRAQVLATTAELTSRQIDVRWLARGGGALMHAPGQLAIYPIIPLAVHRWTVGDYLRRLQAALMAVLTDLGMSNHLRGNLAGIWGRTGQLAVVGAAVKGWVTYQGAFLNVMPAMNLQRLVESDTERLAPLSSLVIDRQQAIKMTAVRAALVPRLAEAFAAPRYHLHTGHPLLHNRARVAHEPARRAV